MNKFTLYLIILIFISCNNTYSQTKLEINKSKIKTLNYQKNNQANCGVFSSDYIQDFNLDFSFSDLCWETLTTSSASITYSNSETVENNGKSVSLSKQGGSTNKSMFISPILDLSQTNNKRFKFWLKRGTVTTSSIVEIGTITDYSDFENINIMDSFVASNLSSEWKQYTIDLNNYTGNDNRFAIKFRQEYTFGNSSQNIYFDHFEYSEKPSCLAPTNFSIDNYNNHELTLSWDEHNSSTEWEVVYSFNEGYYDTVALPVISNPYILNITAQNNMNYFWVRSTCGQDDYSDYSNRVQFYPGCGDSISVGYTQDFDSNTIDHCWTSYEFSSNNSYSDISLDNENYDGGTGNSISMSSSSVNYGTILATPIINDLSADKKIKFWAKKNNGFFRVGTMSNPRDPSTFHELTIINSSNSNVWEEKTVYLNQYNNEDSYVAFMVWGTSGVSNNSFLIDEFSYEQSIFCDEVPEVTVSNILETSTELNWNTATNGIEYEVEYRKLGDTNSTIIATTFNINYIITNLIGDTNYEVRVRTKCDIGLYTYWSDYIPFTTICEEKVAPYFHSFEHSTLYPCWSKNISGIDNVRVIQSENDYNPKTGDYFIKLDPFTGNNQPGIYLISPVLSQLNNLKRIRFSALFNYNNEINSNLQVGTMSDSSDASTFNLIETVDLNLDNLPHNSDNIDWAEYIVYLNNYIGTDQYIAIRSDRIDDTDFYIDDFYYEEIPYCSEPMNAEVVNITYDSATINWINYENSIAQTWEIEYGLAGFTIGNGIQLTSNQDEFILENLQDDTKYDFYLKSNCDNEDSIWTYTKSFTTECIGINPGYFENFNTFPLSVIDNCWTAESNRINIIDDNSFSSPNCIEMINREQIADEIVLVTPRLIDLDSHKRISFWMKLPNPNAYKEIHIGTLSSPYNLSTFSTFHTITNIENNNWIKYEIDFSGINFTDEFIGIKQPSTNGYHTILIDDFEYFESDCNTPTNLLGYQSGSQTATLEWQDNNILETPLSWEIEYGIEGFTQGSGTIITSTTNPATINNLQEQTNYDFYVRAQCQNNFSSWSDKYSFYITCAESTPLIENFDHIDADYRHNYTIGSGNYCWSIIDYNGTEIRDFTPFVTNYTNSAPNLLQFANYESNLTPDPGLFISPFLEDFDSTKILQFWLKKGSSSNTSGIIIGTMKNPLDKSTFTSFRHIQNNEMDTFGQEFIIDFSTYTGNDNFIAFLHDGTAQYQYFSIDDINYRDNDGCITPYNINNVNITSTSTNIIWDTYSSFESFYIEYGNQGFTQGNGTIENTNIEEISIINLSPSTSYDYYIRTNCSTTDQSNWEGPFNFSTNPTSTAIPWFEGFENLTALGTNQFPEGFLANQFMYSTNLVFDNSGYSRYPMFPSEGSNYLAGNPDDDLWIITPSFYFNADETYFFDLEKMIYMYEYNGHVEDTFEIYCIQGHNIGNTSFHLNEFESLKETAFATIEYSTTTQSFTPQTSGEYSFLIISDSSSSSQSAYEVNLDNMSVYNLTRSTIIAELTEDFDDAIYNNIGVSNNVNSLTRIEEELVFSSLSNTNWISARSNQSVWENNESYISTLELKIDATILPLVDLSFELKQTYFENADESQFRILINDELFGDIYQPINHSYDPYQTIDLDLSDFNGQIYNVKLQFLGKNNKFETSNNRGDEAHIDNITIRENNNLDLEDLNFSNLTYYPNPTNGIFNIKAENDIKKVEVYNMLGQNIFTKHYKANEIMLNLNGFENSIYFINVYINDSKKTIKIIKN